MIILIDDYVINVEPTCYTLAIDTHKKDKKGNEVYKTIGYYSSVKEAIKGCVRHINARDLAKDFYTLTEALDLIDANYYRFTELLNEKVNEV